DPGLICVVRALGRCRKDSCIIGASIGSDDYRSLAALPKVKRLTEVSDAALLSLSASGGSECYLRNEVEGEAPPPYTIRPAPPPVPHPPSLAPPRPRREGGWLSRSARPHPRA